MRSLIGSRDDSITHDSYHESLSRHLEALRADGARRGGGEGGGGGDGEGEE